MVIHSEYIHYLNKPFQALPSRRRLVSAVRCVVDVLSEIVMFE